MWKSRLKNLFLILVLSAGTLAILTGLMFADVINEYNATLLTLAGIAIIISLGLNIISGFTGQLSLGQAGLMAIGAYTTAALIMKLHMPIFLAIICGGLVTAIFGFLIGLPTLRLRGDYLAIVTLGFGEVFREVLNNIKPLTGGAAGLSNIPTLANTGDFKTDYIMKFVWIFCFAVISIILVKNLIKSSTGRALISIRDNEIAASAMGINIFYYKVLAFTLSAALAGLGGGLYAVFMGYMNPNVFTWLKSMDYVIIVVLGGMGSITGTVISAILIQFTDKLNEIQSLVNWKPVIYGVLLVILMRFRPQGIMGTKEITFKGIVKFVKSLPEKYKKIVAFIKRKLGKGGAEE